MKRLNNTALAVAEGVEKRGLAKGNPLERNVAEIVRLYNGRAGRTAAA